MLPQAERKQNESFEAYIRRIKRGWQQSGKPRQVRKIRFFEEPKSKNLRKKKKVKHLAIKSKETYLRKIGRLPEEEQYGRNKR